MDLTPADDRTIVHKPHATRSDKLPPRTGRPRQFMCWDGEGYTDTKGIHHYALFGCYRDPYPGQQSDGGLRTVSGDLTWAECFPLLLAAPEHHINVIFAGTYDVGMMFRTVPLHLYQQLYKGIPRYLGQYRVHWRKGKQLVVTDRNTGRSRTLYDVFSFFNCSFVKACREYLGDSPLLDEIERMKLQRDSFDAKDINGSVRQYMGQELVMLNQLCSALQDRFRTIDLRLTKWYGPGAVAQVVLKREGMDEHVRKYDDNQAFTACAESAYYGGRFEQFKRGTHMDHVWQYDIRSAYPAAMAELPSLGTATWTFHNGPPKADVRRYSLCQIRGLTDSKSGVGPVPWRGKGGQIVYPYHVDGWYWGVEIPDDVKILRHWAPTLTRDDMPFAFVPALYAYRAQLKASGDQAQMAVKLALNSLYGKFAQSVGAQLDGKTLEWRKPRYHDVVYAGWITAYTRSRIRQALVQAGPAHIIATETDSVFVTRPLDLDVGTGLGQWELTELDACRYIRSGVSIVQHDGEWHSKTRGFHIRGLGPDDWAQFLAMDHPQMTVRQTRFGTNPLQPELRAKWYTLDYTLNLDSLGEKRIHLPCATCRAGQGYDTHMHPLVVAPVPKVPSTPYSFGWRDGAPEWLQAFETNEHTPIIRMERIN